MTQFFILLFIIIFSINFIITNSSYNILMIILGFFLYFYFKNLKKKIIITKQRYFKMLFKKSKKKLLKKKIENWMYLFYFTVILTQPFFRFSLALVEMIYRYLIFQSISLSLMMVVIIPGENGESDKFILALANDYTRGSREIHQKIVQLRAAGDPLLKDVLTGPTQEVVSCANFTLLSAIQTGFFPIFLPDNVKDGPDLSMKDGKIYQIKNVYKLTYKEFLAVVQRYPKDINIDISYRYFDSEEEGKRILKLAEEINNEKERQITLRCRLITENQIKMREILALRDLQQLSYDEHMRATAYARPYLMNYRVCGEVIVTNFGNIVRIKT